MTEMSFLKVWLNPHPPHPNTHTHFDIESSMKISAQEFKGSSHLPEKKNSLGNRIHEVNVRSRPCKSRASILSS